MNEEQVKTLPIPTLITANGSAYLGRVKEVDGKSTIEQALMLDSLEVTKDELRNYLVAAYSGTLTTAVRLSASSMLSEVDLDKDLKHHWNIAKAELLRSMDMAPTEVVTTHFLKN